MTPAEAAVHARRHDADAAADWDALRQAVRGTMRKRSLTYADVAAAIGRAPTSLQVQVNMRRPPSETLQAALRGWLEDPTPAPAPPSADDPRSRMCAPSAKNLAPADIVNSPITRERWEYVVARIPDHQWEGQSAMLNAYGGAGWRLVSVSGGVAYLRRRVDACG